jgi:DNA-binding beta-propeller fold protein YncE
MPGSLYDLYGDLMTSPGNPFPRVPWKQTVGPFGHTGHTYEVVENWARRPSKWPFIEVSDTAVDAEDNVFVLNRGPHPVHVYDKDGIFLDYWGHDQFTEPHGITVAPDGTIWCADSFDHAVKHFTREGRLLQTLGTRYQNEPELSGRPFNQPTAIAIARTGNIYISDGYRNAAIHVFSPEGKYVRSWGKPGTGPGEFRIVHSVHIDRRDQVYVADRLNNRVQVFDLDGNYLREYADLHWPNYAVVGNDDLLYVAELQHRLSVWTLDGKLITRWGDDGESMDAGKFLGPHGITVDSRGVIYLSDVAESYRGVDRGIRAVQKFIPNPGSR